MSQRAVRIARTCKRCERSFDMTAAELRDHGRACNTVLVQTTKSSPYAALAFLVKTVGVRSAKLVVLR